MALQQAPRHAAVTPQVQGGTLVTWPIAANILFDPDRGYYLSPVVVLPTSCELQVTGTVPPEGFEPPAYGSEDRRSSAELRRQSGPVSPPEPRDFTIRKDREAWWMRDSNPRVICLIYSQVQSPLCQSTVAD